MTIRDYICENEARMAEQRAIELEKIGAPEVMIEAIRKNASELRKGILTCGGDNNLLDIEMESREILKGRGGKPYIKFNNVINYFPTAKYGRFITK